MRLSENQFFPSAVFTSALVASISLIFMLLQDVF